MDILNYKKCFWLACFINLKGCYVLIVLTIVVYQFKIDLASIEK